MERVPPSSGVSVASRPSARFCAILRDLAGERPDYLPVRGLVAVFPVRRAGEPAYGALRLVLPSRTAASPGSFPMSRRRI